MKIPIALKNGAQQVPRLAPECRVDDRRPQKLPRLRDERDRHESGDLVHAQAGLRQPVRNRDRQVAAHRPERQDEEQEDDGVRVARGGRARVGILWARGSRRNIPDPVDRNCGDNNPGQPREDPSLDAIIRRATRDDLALSSREFALLGRLATPQKIQKFVNAIPANHETGGETILSVREVLRQRRAHCIEGAFVAACALWVHGEPPLVMHMDCAPSDWPHVVALFRRGGAWGAISKTNGAVLRFRDPVYRTLRELAMSYFHEYSDKAGRKTLRSRLGADRPAQARSGALGDTRNGMRRGQRPPCCASALPAHSAQQQRLLSPRDAFEREVAKVVQYPAKRD